MSGLTIPFEAADQITLAVMKEHLGFLESALYDHEQGGYMHPEDYHKTKVELIPALKVLIEYFGG